MKYKICGHLQHLFDVIHKLFKHVPYCFRMNRLFPWVVCRVPLSFEYWFENSVFVGLRGSNKNIVRLRGESVRLMGKRIYFNFMLKTRFIGVTQLIKHRKTKVDMSLECI